MDDLDKQNTLADRVGFITLLVILLICALCLIIILSQDNEKSQVQTEEIPTEVVNTMKQSNFDEITSPYSAYGNILVSIKNSEDSANITFSPYSLKLALLLAEEGTEQGSEISNNILKLLGVEEYNSAELSKTLKVISEKPELNIVNSIWYDSTKIDVKNSAYFGKIKELYNADAFEAELTTDDFVKEFNAYVAKNTHNLIPIMLSEPLSSDGAALIADVLYFKDKWYYNFKPEDTQLGTFGSNENAEIMYNSAHYPHVLGYLGFDVVRLPYEDSGLVMDVYQSTSDIDSLALLADLNESDMNALLSLDNVDLSTNTNVNLSFPKFNTRNKIGMKPVLESIGFKDIFAEGDNFPKIAKDLYISDIAQSAKIICDEEGTEAAAVTTVTMDMLSAALPEDFINIDINKPFVYAIRDFDSNEIIFLGYISDVDER